MTEQERKEIIDRYGYPPNARCGECGLWDEYGEHDEEMDRFIENKCKSKCLYYKEMYGGNNANV